MLIDLINSKEKAIIDEDDFEIIKSYKWRISNCGYAVTYKNKTLILMHRLIFYGLDSKGKSRIDHKDGNRINNSKINIRVSTPSQNTMNKHCLMPSNKSGYNGVKWSGKAQKWEASIGLNNKRIFGGYYDNKYEAAIAYDILSLKYFGEFAFINIKNPEKDMHEKILASINSVKKIKGSSIYKGVTKRGNKWVSQISFGGKTCQKIGLFEQEINAAKAYDEVVKKNNLKVKTNFL